MVVIMMGRKRTWQPSVMASSGVREGSWRWASRAKSSIMMAFFFTMPSSMMTPTKP